MSVSYELTVAKNKPPTASVIASMTVLEVMTVSLDASPNFAEPEEETISFAITSSPDASSWLLINTATGLINSIAPHTSVGSYSVTIYGRDPHYSTTAEQGSATFSLIITANQSPILSSSLSD